MKLAKDGIGIDNIQPLDLNTSNQFKLLEWDYQKWCKCCYTKEYGKSKSTHQKEHSDKPWYDQICSRTKSGPASFWQSSLDTGLKLDMLATDKHGMVQKLSCT